jgi:hypothetical protein
MLASQLRSGTMAPNYERRISMTSERPPLRLSLRKQTIRELDAEDLIDVAGGDTAACCVGCSTCGTATWCGCQGGHACDC